MGFTFHKEYTCCPSTDSVTVLNMCRLLHLIWKVSYPYSCLFIRTVLSHITLINPTSSLHSQIAINKHKAFVRFGLTHVVASNVCVWFLTTIMETSEDLRNMKDRWDETLTTAASNETVTRMPTTALRTPFSTSCLACGPGASIIADTSGSSVYNHSKSRCYRVRLDVMYIKLA